MGCNQSIVYERFSFVLRRSDPDILPRHEENTEIDAGERSQLDGNLGAAASVLRRADRTRRGLGMYEVVAGGRDVSATRVFHRARDSRGVARL